MTLWHILNSFPGICISHPTTGPSTWYEILTSSKPTLLSRVCSDSTNKVGMTLANSTQPSVLLTWISCMKIISTTGRSVPSISNTKCGLTSCTTWGEEAKKACTNSPRPALLSAKQQKATSTSTKPSMMSQRKTKVTIHQSANPAKLIWSMWCLHCLEIQKDVPSPALNTTWPSWMKITSSCGRGQTCTADTLKRTDGMTNKKWEKTWWESGWKSCQLLLVWARSTPTIVSEKPALQP